VTVVLPTPDGHRLMVEVASGHRADEMIGYTYPLKDTLVGVALASGQPVRVDDLAERPELHLHLSDLVPVGPVLVLPLHGGQRMRGALVVGRLRGRHRFDEVDLDMATTFANHAVVALELADARADQQRVILLEDRDRIARDLHDHVIQRLFAAGLSVQSVAAGLDAGPAAERLGKSVADIDETIRQIRTTIFQLRGQLGPQMGTVRTRLLVVVEELAPLLSFEPRVEFNGAVDSVVPESAVEELLAVTREALTNVARHAHARQAAVVLAATSDTLTLTVTDDGSGIGQTTRRSGLTNLRERAERHGGAFAVSSGPSTDSSTQQGTQVQWTIPLN
jgi:signal transduction histidine kinase